MFKLEVYVWRTYSSENLWAVVRNKLPAEVGYKVIDLLIYNGVNIRINNELNFMFCWPYISIYPLNENQLDAPFILSLFRHSTSTCFRHICSPSSGGILYIYNNWYVLCFFVDCLLFVRICCSKYFNWWCELNSLKFIESVCIWFSDPNNVGHSDTPPSTVHNV